MRKLLIGLGFIVLLIVVLIIAAPFVVPVERYKPQIIAAVKTATGRELSIDGKLSFRVFPSIGVEASTARLSNVPGGKSPDFLTLDSLVVAVRLFPLLAGDIAIAQFELINPTINLEVDKAGHPNWVFSPAAAASGAAPSTPTPTPTPTPTKAGGPAAELANLQLGAVKLVNGTVTYTDDRTGKSETVSKLGANVSLPSLDDPLSFEGAATWHERPLSLTLTVKKPRALLDEQETETTLKLASSIATIGLTGMAKGGAVPGFTGSLAVDAPLVRDVAKWVGQEIKLEGTGLGPFTLQSHLAAEGAKLSMSESVIALDAIHAKGDLVLDARGAKPNISGALAVDRLDLNPYLPQPKPASAGDKATAQSVAGAPAATGWSEAPIDASGLNAAEIHFDLTTGGIQFRTFEIGEADLKITLADGKLTAELTKLAAYGGAGVGTISINGAEKGEVGLDSTVKFQGIQAQPLLTAAVGIDRLAGTGALQFAVTGRGGSEKALVGALNGKAEMHIADGSIRGVDLAAMMRNIGSAFTAGSSSQKTDFSALDATATITNGIVKNDDLALLAPLIRVAGAGTVDLPQQTVNYRIEPKLVGTLQGQGGGEASGLAVPIIIEGPWSHVAWRPDLAGLLKQKLDPSQLLKGATGNGASIGKPADVLKGLFGGH